MNTNRPAKVQIAVKALLTQPGECTPELRQAIRSYAIDRSLGGNNPDQLSKDLVSYIDKVILHAYKITDADVNQLLDNGYSQDQIFEITLCGSVGAADARLDSGLSALTKYRTSAPN